MDPESGVPRLRRRDRVRGINAERAKLRHGKESDEGQGGGKLEKPKEGPGTSGLVLGVLFFVGVCIVTVFVIYSVIRG